MSDDTHQTTQRTPPSVRFRASAPRPPLPTSHLSLAYQRRPEAGSQPSLAALPLDATGGLKHDRTSRC
ncbi:hypothetical protein JHW43_008721 [Diplocarpon mali]|nr:hypothetical protein JHW43_008721 [Diplocarpon mali]